MRTRLGAVVAIPVAALLLTACVAPSSGPRIQGDPVDVDFEVPDASRLTGLSEVHWSTGIVDVFDDVVAMLPDIAPLREQFTADDAAYGATVMTTLGIDPTALATTLPKGGHLSRGAATITDSDTIGNFMVGALAPGAVGGAMNEADAGSFGDQDSVSNNGVTMTRDENGDVSVKVEHDSSASNGGTAAASTSSASYDGTYCPGPDGKFDAILQTQRAVTAQGGAGTASYAQSVRVEVSGTLNDEAFPEAMEVTTSQRTTRTDASGATTAATTAQATNWYGGPGLDPGKNPPRKVEDSAGSDAAVAGLVADGQARAAAMAVGMIPNLYRLWTEGGCVKIDTDAPTQVKPNSQTDFTIRVLRKATNAEVTGPLTLTLAGEKNVDPKKSVSTGGFHYTSGKQGTKGELTIVSTSKQGGAKKTHTFSTQAAYRVTGGWGAYTVDTSICSADVFATPAWGLELTGGGGGYTFGGSSLGLSYDSGGGHLVTLQGSWSLTKDDDGAPTAIDGTVSGMEITGAGTISPSITPVASAPVHFTIAPADDTSSCG